MLSKNRTFLENTKEYLFPFFMAKKVTAKSLAIYGLWSINPIIHIIFIQNLVSFLESGIRGDFIFFLSYYILYCVVYEFLDFSMRKWGWVENINTYRKIIDDKYIRKFIKIDNNAVESEGTGKLVSIITGGSDTWALSLDRFLLEISRIVYILIFAIYMVFNIEVIFGFGFILFFTLLFFMGFYANSKSLVYRRKRVEIYNTYVKSYVRIIMSKLEVMQSDKVQYEIKGRQTESELIIAVNKKMATWVHWSYKSSELSLIIIKIAIFGYVGLGILDGTYTFAFFIGLFGIITLLDGSLVSAIRFLRDFTANFTKIERLWKFFDENQEMKGYTMGNQFILKKGDIEVKNLTYGYNNASTVFLNFQLKQQGGKITALVGPSGGGKSTLVKLIAGYIQANAGDIIVDGQKLSETSLKSYFKEIGYLTQEPSVFDGTIRENLSYALVEEAAEEKLNKILELAGCDFVFDFKDGIDTEIGEKGIRLSGGQRQRLAIAKIFLKDPKIIILDEPTSALDSFSEAKIAQAMENLFKGRTVIVIAHRLQTVKHADDIIYIKDGKIIERGNHKELVKQGGLYKQMLDLQSGF